MWGLAHAGFCRTTSKCRKTKVASTMSNEECVCGTSHGGFNRTGSIHSIPRVGTVLWGGSTVSIKLLAGAGVMVCVLCRREKGSLNNKYSDRQEGAPAFRAVTERSHQVHIIISCKQTQNSEAKRRTFCGKCAVWNCRGTVDVSWWPLTRGLLFLQLRLAAAPPFVCFRLCFWREGIPKQSGQQERNSITRDV